MALKIKNNTKQNVDGFLRLVGDFYPYAQRKMGFNRPPTINLASDTGNARNPLGKTAQYEPGSMTVTLYIDKRHPKDVLRSLSHELVHHTQNCNGKFSQASPVAGEDGYAQKDPHLRSMEEDAYLKGNMVFRDWEDGFKLKQTIYIGEGNDSPKEKKKMKIDESAIRAAVRKILKASLLREAEEEEEGGEKPWTNLSPDASAEEMLAAVAAFMAEKNIEPVQGLGADYTPPDISWRAQGKATASRLPGEVNLGGEGEGDELPPPPPGLDDVEGPTAGDLEAIEAEEPELEEGKLPPWLEKKEEGEEEEGEEDEPLDEKTKKDSPDRRPPDTPADRLKPLEEVTRRKKRARGEEEEKKKAAEAAAKAAEEEKAAAAAKPKAAPRSAPPAKRSLRKTLLGREKAEKKEELKEWWDRSLFDRLVDKYTK